MQFCLYHTIVKRNAWVSCEVSSSWLLLIDRNLRERTSVMCSVTKLFYSRPGKTSETYFPAPTLSKPEQYTDNKKKPNKDKRSQIN